MDVTWLVMLLNDVGISSPSLPVMHCDNISAIAFTANPVFHSRTKHIVVDHHFVREKAQHKELEIHLDCRSAHEATAMLTVPSACCQTAWMFAHQFAGEC